MTTIYIKENDDGGECIREPGDGWDNGDYANYVSIGGLCISTPTYQFDQIDTDEDIAPGDIVFLTWARYSDGDTFGYTDGYMWYGLVTKDAEKAKEFEEKAQSGEGQIDVYYPWHGYFAGLSSLQTDVFVVSV